MRNYLTITGGTIGGGTTIGGGKIGGGVGGAIGAFGSITAGPTGFSRSSNGSQFRRKAMSHLKLEGGNR
jgi:hypothetical protein